MRKLVYSSKIQLNFSYNFKVSITYQRREIVGITKFKTPKAFIDYSQTIDDVYENLKDYNPTKTKVFNDMTECMEPNKN